MSVKEPPSSFIFKLSDNLPIDSIPKAVVLVKGITSVYNLPHILSVKILQSYRKIDEDRQLLWLDGDNSFNPYLVSQIARIFEAEPEKILEKIQISRTFTCHQLSKLILEKLWDTVEKLNPELVVVTGLPSIFAESDLCKREVSRSFEPVLEELEKFRREERGLLMTSGTNSTGKNVILPKLESLSDIILDVRKGGKEIGIEIGKDFSKSFGSSRIKVPEFESKSNMTLEEFTESGRYG